MKTKINQILKTLSLLTSMIKSGEQFTDESYEAVKDAQNNCDAITDSLTQPLGDECKVCGKNLKEAGGLYHCDDGWYCSEHIFNPPQTEQPLKAITEEKIRKLLIHFLDSIRHYEHESHTLLGHDKRESGEFVDTYFETNNHRIKHLSRTPPQTHERVIKDEISEFLYWCKEHCTSDLFSGIGLAFENFKKSTELTKGDSDER